MVSPAWFNAFCSFLLFRVVGCGCGLADLLLNVIQRFLDGAFVLRGVAVVAVLRRAVLEEAFALFDALLDLLAFDRVGRRASLARSFTILLVVAQGLELVRHRFQFIRRGRLFPD